MYRLFTITLSVLLLMGFTHSNRLAGQGARVSIESAAMWPVDGYSLVVVRISGVQGKGPARFFMNLPKDFSAMVLDEGSGYFYFENQQVNLLWNQIPLSGEIRASIYVRPGTTHSTPFSIAGTFHFVTEGSVNRGVASAQVLVSAGGAGGLTPSQASAARSSVLAARRIPQPVLPESSRDSEALRAVPVTRSVGAAGRSERSEAAVTGRVVYRIQVASSSTRLSDSELKSRLGIKVSDRITVTQEGNIFRYQVGELIDYEAAERLLATIRRDGVEGAFMVAFRDGVQISVSEARRVRR